MTENPYQSPTAVDSTPADPPPKIGLGAWLGVGVDAILTFLVLLALAPMAVLASEWIWLFTLGPNKPAGEHLPQWLMPYYAAGSILVAAASAWYRATYTLRKWRERATRRAEIHQQRREAIESARRRHP